MSWYRVYRPQMVSDLALPDIRNVLNKVLETGQYAHSYLFVGTRGTGKTSAARILAKILNDPRNAEAVKSGKGPLVEPNDQTSLLRQIAAGEAITVIEQDAASHGGVDDVRALQELISLAPAEGLVRVVILDEAHMLTTAAFNALLKMLEEPPPRVVFVLCTTEKHKVPLTVQSRCQIVDFRSATAAELESVLADVAKKQNIKIDANEIKMLAQHANGSFRDGIKLLEQWSVADPESREQGMLDERLENLLRSLGKKDITEVQAWFVARRQENVAWDRLADELVLLIRQRLQRAIERAESNDVVVRLGSILRHLLDNIGGWEPIPGIRLELACLEWCWPTQAVPPVAEVEFPIAEVSIAEQKVDPKKMEPSKKNESSASSDPGKTLELGAIQSSWENLLLSARASSQSLESLLRLTTIHGVEGNRLVLTTGMSFHAEQLMSSRFKPLLSELLSQVFGYAVHVEVRHDPALAKSVPSSSGEGTTVDELARAAEAALLGRDQV